MKYKRYKKPLCIVFVAFVLLPLLPVHAVSWAGPVDGNTANAMPSGAVNHATSYVCPACGSVTPEALWCCTCQRCMGCCICGSSSTSGVAQSIVVPGDSHGCVCPNCGHAKSCDSECTNCGYCDACRDVSSSLQASIRASKSGAAVNEEIVFYASWSGGMAPYNVRLFFYDASTGNGNGIKSEGLSAGNVDWPTKASVSGIYRCRVEVGDHAGNTRIAETGIIRVGETTADMQPGVVVPSTAKPTSTTTPAPSKTPAPKPAAKPSGKLRIDYIEPTSISAADSNVIAYEIGISNAQYPCTVQYEISDLQSGEMRQLEQNGIMRDSFKLLLGPEVSGAVNLKVRVSDSRGASDEKERSTADTGESSSEAAANNKKKEKLQISGIHADEKDGMIHYTVTIEGGTAPFNISYDLKYGSTETHNIWSGYIAEERNFKMMSRAVPVNNIVFKVWDAAGASAEKEYLP